MTPSHPSEEILSTSMISELPSMSQVLFGLALELYAGRGLSPQSLDFFERLAPQKNLAFIARREQFLLPDNFEPLPLEIVWRTIANGATGIFCRTVIPEESGIKNEFTLCAANLGNTAGGDELAVGFIGSEKWNRNAEIQETFANQVGRLRRYYEEFCHLKIIDNLMHRDNFFDYLVDLESFRVIACRCPGEYLQMISNLPESSPVSERFLCALFDHPTDWPEDSDPALPGNMNITRFQIGGFDYAGISIKAPIGEEAKNTDCAQLVRDFIHDLNNKLGSLQSASEQLTLHRGRPVSDADLALLEIIQNTSEEMTAVVNRFRFINDDNTTNPGPEYNGPKLSHSNTPENSNRRVILVSEQS